MEGGVQRCMYDEMGAFSISELGSEWEWCGVFVTKSGMVVGFHV